jgi:peroxin-10
VKLLAALLYHGLTTGMGSTTLGDEYCDILQSSASGQLPHSSQQLLLVLLQSVGPYVADRVVTAMERSAPEQQQNNLFEEPDST